MKKQSQNPQAEHFDSLDAALRRAGTIIQEKMESCPGFVKTLYSQTNSRDEIFFLLGMLHTTAMIHTANNAAHTRKGAGILALSTNLEYAQKIYQKYLEEEDKPKAKKAKLPIPNPDEENNGMLKGQITMDELIAELEKVSGHLKSIIDSEE